MERQTCFTWNLSVWQQNIAWLWRMLKQTNRLAKSNIFKDDDPASGWSKPVGKAFEVTLFQVDQQQRNAGGCDA